MRQIILISPALLRRLLSDDNGSRPVSFSFWKILLLLLLLLLLVRRERRRRRRDRGHHRGHGRHRRGEGKWRRRRLAHFIDGGEDCHAAAISSSVRLWVEVLVVQPCRRDLWSPELKGKCKKQIKSDLVKKCGASKQHVSPGHQHRGRRRRDRRRLCVPHVPPPSLTVPSPIFI